MIITALRFLLANEDVIEAIAEVIQAGVSKETLLKCIKRAMIEASDELVEKEVGTP